MKTLAEMCKEIRERTNMSQTALAKLIGTNQTEISFIERGFMPSQDKITKIERLYGGGRAIKIN